MRILVMGDIHGAHKALLQCLKKATFDKEKDVLIQLGDIADGYNDEVDECVAELLTIRNLIALKGNHDEWFNQFILTGCHPDAWIRRGTSTARSYLRRLGKEKMMLRTSNGYKTALNPGDIPEEHRLFFHQQRLYHIDEWNNCYVHRGFDRGKPFKGQRPEVYYWDRDLWLAALSFDSGFLHQNHGYFPKRRRKEFEKLTDDEIQQMQGAYRTIFVVA